MRVAVVGAGLAGLACARALGRAGIPVTLYEARPEAGGRVRSRPLGSGGDWETGGEWIDADHPRLTGLLAEFGLAPIPASPLPGALSYGGSLVLDGAWPDVAEEEERLEREAARRAAALREPVWEESAQAGLDHVPLRAFVESVVPSERGRWLAGARLRSDEGEDLDRISTLGWLWGWRNYLGREEGAMSALRCPVGLGGLARRLLGTLAGADVRFGREVETIDAGESSVAVDGEPYEGVVLAIPPRAIERVRFGAALPAATRCALEGIGAARAFKIALRFSRAFWTERGLSGRVLSDGPLQQLWAGPRPESDPVLSVYVVGNGASGWAVLGDPVRAAVYETGRIFPEAPGLFVEGDAADWTGPVAGGAFPYVPPGFVTSHLSALGRPAGRVHFAGDWCPGDLTGGWMGFAEGALESGERAAREMLEG